MSSLFNIGVGGNSELLGVKKQFFSGVGVGAPAEINKGVVPPASTTCKRKRGRPRKVLRPLCPWDWFWGFSQQLKETRAEIQLASRSDSTVLLVGETGAGKEILARELHYLRSQRLGSTCRTPYVPINCGAIPESLAESILFGHERGAFTSARDRQKGKFELAESGILFLDEIQSLSIHIQTKLLRVLQHREVERLGAKSAEKIDCQIVASTNLPLEFLVEKNQFRKDLYYRLNVCPVYLPPLRKRKEDLPFLISGLMKQICTRLQISTKEIHSDVFELFLNYQWPGNLRELEHCLHYSCLRASRSVTLKDLPKQLTGELHRYLKEGDWNL